MKYENIIRRINNQRSIALLQILHRIQLEVMKTAYYCLPSACCSAPVAGAVVAGRAEEGIPGGGREEGDMEIEVLS